MATQGVPEGTFSCQFALSIRARVRRVLSFLAVQAGWPPGPFGPERERRVPRARRGHLARSGSPRPDPAARPRPPQRPLRRPGSGPSRGATARSSRRAAVPPADPGAGGARDGVPADLVLPRLGGVELATDAVSASRRRRAPIDARYRRFRLQAPAAPRPGPRRPRSGRQRPHGHRVLKHSWRRPTRPPPGADRLQPGPAVALPRRPVADAESYATRSSLRPSSPAAPDSVPGASRRGRNTLRVGSGLSA